MKLIASTVLGNPHIRKTTTLIAALIAVPLILASATNARADGTHGCQISVQNNYVKTDWKVQVHTYNGKDGVCHIGHDYDEFSGEGLKIAYAHSQGSEKCTLQVRGYTTTTQDQKQKALCKNLGEGDRCGGGLHTIRVPKKGSVIINADGTCSVSE